MDSGRLGILRCMTEFTQAATSAPGLLLAMAGVAMAGPAALVAALRARGWTPLRDARRRFRRTR